jgi:drug/metabolite transporter (DMT)-like permease
MHSPVTLFAIAAVIWGSTWLAITFQLGVVNPEVSVVYRFALAAAILFVACGLRRRPLGFPPRIHALMAAQGATLFGLNYVGVYLAEQHVASGLVAVAFSTLVFLVPIGARLFYGIPLLPRVVLGALLGVAGVAALFLPELRTATAGGSTALGVAYALGSTVIAAVGNLVTVRLHRDEVPVMSGTAWGMGYGAFTAAAVAWARGSSWGFDWRASYVISLVYLAVFGSIVAFGAYFKLIERVGAGRASFTAVAIPVVAMGLSTVFENYRWTATAAAGAALALAGNYLALTAARRKAG